MLRVVRTSRLAGRDRTPGSRHAPEHHGQLGVHKTTAAAPDLLVRYQPGPGVHEELADLAAAEQTCCSFLSWSVTNNEGQLVLRVSAPAEAPDAVAPIAAMFGAAQAPSRLSP